MVVDGIVQKSVVSSCRPSIVTFPLSLGLRFSEILPRLCSGHATFRHSTFTLPKISLCSLGSRWMAFGIRRAKVLG